MAFSASANPSSLSASNMTTRFNGILRIGVVGLGEIAQVNHISMLNNLSDYYQITYLCDASQEALQHCAKKVAGRSPKTTSDPEELVASPDVDVVLLCNATAYHTSHTILALKQNKHVLVEKPITLNYRDLNGIIAAEKDSKGKVFIGYQRRYAEAFLDAVKEVGGMGKIQYARVRDIIGLNSTFVSQSTTFPKRFTDFKAEDSKDMTSREEEIMREALVHDFGLEPTPESMNMLSFLGSLGSHDLSAMREILGMPQKVIGASLGFPFWTVLFQYDGFPVTYESGINNVPIFDAHIEVYSNEKIVRVNYDSPYVKGLPVTMTIRERIEGASGGGYQERTVRKTYEDPYTLEFLKFHQCVLGNISPKTSPTDALNDLDLFKMIMQAGNFPKA